jgi:hypothetical protein
MGSPTLFDSPRTNLAAALGLLPTLTENPSTRVQVELYRQAPGVAFVYIGASRNFRQRDGKVTPTLPAGYQWHRYSGAGPGHAGHRVLVVSRHMGFKNLTRDQEFAVTAAEVFLIATVRSVFGYSPDAPYRGKDLAVVRNISPFGIKRYVWVRAELWVKRVLSSCSGRSVTDV